MLELSSDKVNVEMLFLILRCITAEVFVVYQGLAETSSDTIQDNVDEVLAWHLGIAIKSIDIM